MELSYDFFLLWFIGILLIFSIVIGVNKMIKVIIGNYLLIWIALALHLGIDFVGIFLESNTISFIKNQEEFSKTLIEYKELIILTTYLIFLILIFTKSTIWIVIAKNWFLRMLLGIIFAPLTVISIMFGLSVVIYWSEILNTQNVFEIIDKFEEWTIIHSFLYLTPLWMILPAFLALIFSTEIKINRKTKSSNNDWEKEQSTE